MNFQEAVARDARVWQRPLPQPARSEGLAGGGGGKAVLPQLMLTHTSHQI